MGHHQIIVVGPIASGKTTASQLLAKELGLPLLNARWSFRYIPKIIWSRAP
jgi:cytidylate kinase